MSNADEFDCTLDGFQLMVRRITNLALLAITVNTAIIEAIISGLPNLAYAFNHMVTFLQSSSGFAGYTVAAGYYFGLEFGYGDLMCEASKYGYVVIYYLDMIISFGQDNS